MVNKITSPITPLGEIDKINEIIDEVDKKLENTATGTNGLTIGGSASTANSATNIGFASSAGSVGTAVGYNTAANGSRSTSIGYNARIGAAVSDAIQIGSGTNPTAKTLCVGFYNYGNYPMLDGTTGKIPTDRIKYDGTTITVNSNGELTSTGGSGSRNIGEIVSSTIPLTDAGLHLLDGALIQGSGIYSAFVTYIAGLRTQYSSLFTTESDWQSTVTQYGVCGKFVYNSTNNTVRLPKYSDKIYTQGLNTTAPVIGNGIALGLTNGTTNYGLSNYSGNGSNATSIYTNYYGASVTSKGGTPGSQPDNHPVLGVTTDPDKSGLVAQLSNITTSLDGYYYIVIATSTKTDIQVDIDEIATDLNGKADRDLSNTTPAISFATAMNTAGIRTVVETYRNGSSWYRIYSDGWCEQGGQNDIKNSGTTITLLKSYTHDNFALAGSVNARISWALNQSGNDSIYIRSDSSTTYKITWQACGYIR